MANTFSNLLYHVIFSTKNRLPLISESFRDDLYKYIGGIVRTDRGLLLEIGGVSDHVHLGLKLKTDVSVADIVRRIKGGSSKWLNESLKNKGRFSWQDGYGIFTVSESQWDNLGGYIRNQENHHHKKTFQEEYLELLRLNNIEFDERYLWN